MSQLQLVHVKIYHLFLLAFTALPFLAKAALRFANGSGFAFLPAFLSAAATFLAALLVDTSVAFRFATASYGLSCNMALTFFNGFILKTALWIFLFGALKTLRISSDLSNLDRSVTAILGWGKFQLFFSVEFF